MFQFSMFLSKSSSEKMSPKTIKVKASRFKVGSSELLLTIDKFSALLVRKISNRFELDSKLEIPEHPKNSWKFFSESLQLLGEDFQDFEEPIDLKTIKVELSRLKVKPSGSLCDFLKICRRNFSARNRSISRVSKLESSSRRLELSQVPSLPAGTSVRLRTANKIFYIGCAMRGTIAGARGKRDLKRGARVR